MLGNMSIFWYNNNFFEGNKMSLLNTTVTEQILTALTLTYN